MPTITIFTRGAPGSPGSASSLAYMRRIAFPYQQLASHRLLSLGHVTLQEDQELTPSMLLAQGVCVFQDWLPRSSQEVTSFEHAYIQAQESGRLFALIYDLTVPDLLAEPAVQDILPLMRLVTVPNERLRTQTKILSHAPLQQVATLPSTFDLAWLTSTSSFPPLSSPSPTHHAYGLGCLGQHDWSRFLPSFLPLFSQKLARCGRTGEIILIGSAQQIEPLARQYDLSCLTFQEPLLAQDYAFYLSCCSLGLLPREGADLWDCALLQEYAACGIPVLAASGSSYEDEWLAGYPLFLPFSEPESWGETICSLLFPDEAHAYDYQGRSQTGKIIAQNRRVQNQSVLLASLMGQILPGFARLP